MRYSVPTAHYKLCECVGGNSSVPREVTCENEHSVTLLSHVHLQQAIPVTANSYDRVCEIHISREFHMIL